VDREILEIERALKEHPGDRPLRRKLAQAFERSGEGERSVTLLAGLLEGADETELGELGSSLARLTATTSAVARLVDLGPTAQAKACMRALVLAGAPDLVVRAARRTGEVRSLAAARALRARLGSDLDEVPTPPALLVMVEREARELFHESPEELVGLTELDDYIGGRDDEYVQLLEKELEDYVAEDVPWVELASVVVARARSVVFLPWLEALVHSSAGDLSERAQWAAERLRTSGTT
jgi:hypothetical protein